MRQFIFGLSLTYEECLPYYTGDMQAVIVRSECGKRVQIPAIHLRGFIDTLGIRGRFRLTLDNDNKFQQLEKLN